VAINRNYIDTFEELGTTGENYRKDKTIISDEDTFIEDGQL
jgi:hypothetical protein